MRTIAPNRTKGVQEIIQTTIAGVVRRPGPSHLLAPLK